MNTDTLINNALSLVVQEWHRRGGEGDLRLSVACFLWPDPTKLPQVRINDEVPSFTLRISPPTNNTGPTVIGADLVENDDSYLLLLPGAPQTTGGRTWWAAWKMPEKLLKELAGSGPPTGNTEGSPDFSEDAGERWRQCAAEDCQKEFWDETPGKTRQYCSEPCRNRTKVRRHRKKSSVTP